MTSIATGTPGLSEERPRQTYLQGFARFLREKPLGTLGLAIMIAFGIMAIVSPYVVPKDILDTNAKAILNSPNANAWFGTDQFGRDLFSRTLYGSRISMMVGFAVLVMGTTVGSILAIITAYIGGKVDLLTQRVVDALMAIPTLVLALTIMSVLGASMFNLIIAISIGTMPNALRTVRSVVLSIKATQYVDSARAVGAGNLRIMAIHVAPNVMAPYLVIASVALGGAILGEASLSFLGAGAPEETVTWGSLLSRDKLQYFALAPWMAIFPGLFLTALVFGINVFGDALRDVLDPRLRGSR